MIAFGLVGYLMKKTGFEPGPMVLAFVLGSLLEKSFRQSMLIFDGNAAEFVTRPISGSLILIIVMVIALPIITAVRRRRSHSSDTPSDKPSDKSDQEAGVR